MSTVLSFRDSVVADVPPLIGTSPAMELARRRIELFAKSPLSVLLVGPTGTGKDLLARHLHAQSGRRGQLVDVNCGALPREMIESLLFGHRRGAFTGATESTTGLIVQADRGTLFLDELSSLSLEGQAKLLRVVETGEVLPLGSSQKLRVDFRLIAAVQEDIEARVLAGLFRRDLFHRVAGLRIELPDLTERREDIPLLASHFASAQGCTLTEDALALLEARAWPGNVRELRALIGRAAILAPGSQLGADLIAEGTHDRCRRPPSSDDKLLLLCRAHGGHSGAIARALGVSRATLFRRLRAHGISLHSLRVSQSLETL